PENLDADGNYPRHHGCDCRDDCVYAAELTPVFSLSLWERVGVRASGRRDLILSGGGFALPDLQKNSVPVGRVSASATRLFYSSTVPSVVRSQRGAFSVSL